MYMPRLDGKSKCITIRVTEEQYKVIKDLAAERGVSMSQTIIDILKEELGREKSNGDRVIRLSD